MLISINPNNIEIDKRKYEKLIAENEKLVKENKELKETLNLVRNRIGGY